MGVRLMPMPEYFRTGILTVPKRMDLIALVKLVSYMVDLQMVASTWYGSPLRQLMKNADFKEATRRPEINPDELDRFATQANLPAWSVELNFYGSEKTTAANWDYAKELLARHVPAGRAIDGEDFPLPPKKEQYEKGSQPYQSALRRNVVFGKPGLGIWYQAGRNLESPTEYNQTHFGLMSVLPRSGEAVFEFQKGSMAIARELEIESGLGPLSTPSTQQQYSFKMASRWGAGLETTMENRRKQLAMIKKVLEMNAKHGWGDYRAPPMLQDAVAAQYDFNGHAMLRFHEAMKDAVDPNGILAPGRGGVWPAPYRSHREKI
jgi:4-cresol dehydrogenase (hydroxylating)